MTRSSRWSVWRNRSRRNRSSYYYTAYEEQNGFRIGWDITGINQAQAEKVISKPLGADGKNFSERIWAIRNG